MKRAIYVPFILFALHPVAVSAQYAVPHGTFSGGGGVRSGGHLLYDTAVQTGVSVISGGSYIIKSGFWYNAEISSTVDVAIASFDCSYSGETVSLSWSVTSSVPFLGYNLYRREGDRLEFERINDDLLEPLNPCTFTDENVLPGSTYRYLLGAVETDGKERFSAEISVVLPAKPLTLYQNYPNPFNPSTVIRFFLPGEARVTLVLYNASGARLRTLHEGMLPAGNHTVRWDGSNEAGTSVETGVYFYRMQAGKKVLTRKMVLLR